MIDHKEPPTLGPCGCGASHDHFYPGDLVVVSGQPVVWCGPQDSGHWVDFNQHKSMWFNLQ